MKKRFRNVLQALSAAVVGLSTLGSLAWGAPTLTVVGRGNGLFEVMGQGLEGVGGVDMTLTYDRALYANPRVTLGGLFSGAIMAPNLSIPGTVKIGIISPNPQGISGNGAIATLTLSPVAGAQGTISNFTAQIISATGGVTLPAQTGITALNEIGVTPPGASSTSSVSQNTSGVLSGGAAQGTGPVVGALGVTMPETFGGAKPSQPPPPAPVVAENDRRAPPEVIETPVTVAEPPPAPAPAPVAPSPAESAVVTRQADVKSIPELFREYAGPKTPAIMAALFPSGPSAGVLQEPPIALSDGTSKIKVSLNVTVGARSPNFALNGAKLVSLRRDGDLYLLEVLPDSRVNEVTITILNNGVITRVPLVVTQPLNPALIPGGILSETSLDLFLNGGPGKRSDLNGDGKIDYLDEYIITANYLLGKKTSAQKTAVPPKPPAVPAAVVKSVK